MSPHGDIIKVGRHLATQPEPRSQACVALPDVFPGAKPGSKATRFRESITSSTLRLVSSRKPPDIGARISWLLANAENKPDLNTWTVIMECSSSMGWT